MSDPNSKHSLKKRVLSASGWVVGGQVTAAAVRLGGNLLLTRLLVPEAFGLMAIVYVMMTGFLLFSDIGLGPNVVQSKRGEDQAFLDTVWSVQVVRGLLVWIGALLLSIGLYAAGQTGLITGNTVYADPMLPWIVAVYSSTQFIAGFYPTRLLVQGRRFSLARLTQIEIAQQLICLLIMVVWALIDRSIWALVGGTVITAILRLPLYHYFLPGEGNKWHWDKHALTEIVGFGKWVFLSSIIGFVVMSGDRLLLGGLVDAHQLGLYSIAFLIISFPQISSLQLIGKVAFPAISEVLRKNPQGLRKTYYKFRLYFDAALLLAGGLLFTFGESLIKLLYDHRYDEAGWIIQVLAVSFLATRFQLADRCYLALGKPNQLIPVNLVRLASLFLFVPLAFKQFGFEGAVWAIALCPFVSLPLTFYFKMKHAIFDWKAELKVLPIFLIGAAVGKVLDVLVEPLQLIISQLHQLSNFVI